MLKRFTPSWVIFALAVFCADVVAQSGVFLTLEDFHAKAFGGQKAQQGTLWLNAEQKAVAKKILGHDFNRLRVRYWHKFGRSAWVLEEIGKDLPITLGVVVESQRIVNVEVMEFRESRGGEIRHDFFTKQFKGLGLLAAPESSKKAKLKLDRPVDGITGATMSVRATKKVATLALFFHQQAQVGEAGGGQVHE